MGSSPQDRAIDGSVMGSATPAATEAAAPRSLSHYVPIPILASVDATPTARAIRLAVAGTELAGQYTTPGQYVQILVDDHPPTFFSIASAPEDAEVLELLIRRRGPAAEALSALDAGDEVWVSPVAGAGFPVERASGTDLLLFATGSGIAPIRAVIRHVIAQREAFGAVHLYYGAREEAEIAFANELEGWRASGVEIEVVLSQPAPGWDGVRGYVQEALKRAEPDVSRAVAMVCGMDGMVAEVTETLAAWGFPPEHVFKNF